MVRPLRVRSWQKLMLVACGMAFLAATLFGVLLLLILRESMDPTSEQGGLGLLLCGWIVLVLGWIAGSMARSAIREREHEHERAHR